MGEDICCVVIGEGNILFFCIKILEKVNIKIVVVFIEI